MSKQNLNKKSDQIQVTSSYCAFVVDSSDDAIFSKDLNGVIITWNPGAERIYGYTAEDAIGKHVSFLAPPDNLDEIPQILTKIKDGKRVDHFETDRIKKDGTIVKVSVTISPIYDVKSNVIGASAIARDITAKKRAEQELAESRQRIVDVQEALRKDIAQEIHGTVQSRLIVLMHQLSAWQSLCSDAESENKIRNLYNEIDNLIENHLRPISHRLYPSILRRGVTPALESLGDEIETHISIDITIDNDFRYQEREEPLFLPEKLKLGLYRIAAESLNNVVKHANSSKTVVQLQWVRGKHICLQIEDNGIGFVPENIQRGLGITIMRDYIKVLDGLFELHSEPGIGTKIVAILPFVGLPSAP